MNIFSLSVLFFSVGCLEYFIDQWERLVSIRLKILPTLLYSVINNFIDFFMYVFLFSILINFWETWHTGVHDYYKLIPYALYTLGKIGGVTLATWLYAKNKKKRDKDKSLKWLEKGRQKKRKLQEINKDISSTVEVSEEENLFDPVEADDIKEQIKHRVIDKASERLAKKIDDAFKESSEKEPPEEKVPEKSNEEKAN